MPIPTIISLKKGTIKTIVNKVNKTPSLSARRTTKSENSAHGQWLHPTGSVPYTLNKPESCDCGKDYIGMKSRTVKTRTKEHQTALLFNELQKSVIAEHAMEK